MSEGKDTSGHDLNSYPLHTDPPFPSHERPRVWLLTAGESPIAVALTQLLLNHGDFVVSCIRPLDGDNANDNPRFEGIKRLVSRLVEQKDESASRIKVISADIRSVADSQATIAESVKVFGRIDILFCCSSEALIGSIEELAQSSRTRSLVTDQFDTNFFSAVNIIKAALPELRSRRSGHIILLTGITGHLGTPGLGMYCASQWAIEGYCDSLAYEVAPFNIKISIVQSNIEISVLTNKLTSVPPLDPYTSDVNPAPLARGIWSQILDKMYESSTASTDGQVPSIPSPYQKPSELLNSKQTSSLHPQMPVAVLNGLLAETLHAIAAIGGHDNPPSRHIVSHDGVASVKEKLRTVSEELEDFVGVSSAVDL